MSVIEVSKVIAATPETLYDIVSDLPRMGDLSPENTGGVWLDNVSGPTVGARFRGTNSNGKKHWATEAVIEEAERGTVFCFKVGVGPIKISRWRYTFEPVDGGTKVTETWEDRRNWIAKKVGSAASGVSDRPDHNKRGMEVTLGNLARAARGREAAQGPTPPPAS
jgi:hypothetical protein